MWLGWLQRQRQREEREIYSPQSKQSMLQTNWTYAAGCQGENCILYLVFFYLAAFKRHYSLRLAIAPEFLCCSYMCLFYVCALGRWNKISNHQIILFAHKIQVCFTHDNTGAGQTRLLSSYSCPMYVYVCTYKFASSLPPMLTQMYIILYKDNRIKQWNQINLTFRS